MKISCRGALEWAIEKQLLKLGNDTEKMIMVNIS